MRSIWVRSGQVGKVADTLWDHRHTFLISIWSSTYSAIKSPLSIYLKTGGYERRRGLTRCMQSVEHQLEWQDVVLLCTGIYIQNTDCPIINCWGCQMGKGSARSSLINTFHIIGGTYTAGSVALLVGWWSFVHWWRLVDVWHLNTWMAQRKFRRGPFVQSTCIFLLI